MHRKYRGHNKKRSSGEGSYVWRIERFQIDAIKFERMQIHFFQSRFHCRRRRSCLRSLLISTLQWFLQVADASEETTGQYS